MVKRVLRYGYALGAGALLLGLSGCGGANLGGTVNEYYGTYIATYSASNNTFGTATSFNIDTNGNFTGYLIPYPTATATITVSGTVTNTAPPPATATGGVVISPSTTSVPFTGGTFNSFGHGWLFTFTFGTPAVTYNVSLQPQ